MAHHLAQVNIARLRAPLDSEQLADFVSALDPVNASADAAPGFVWRLQSDGGNATDISGFEWDAGESSGVIVNMSVWTGLEPLADWVFAGMHREILRQRARFFERVREATTALWWVPVGHEPSVVEAEDRVRLLRRSGPGPEAFTIRQPFPAPSAPATAAAVAPKNDWLCPA